MGARSEVSVVGHPWPVVFRAFQECLPAEGYRILDSDGARGRLLVRRGNTRITLSVGALDPVRTTWLADAELRVGLLPDRHDHHFRTLAGALERYLAAYYGPAAGGAPA